MTEKLPVWIDTDAGADDAAALTAACRMERLDLRGVSAAAGCMEQARAFTAARGVLSLVGREDVPVYPGAAGPLLRSLPERPAGHESPDLTGLLAPSAAPEETLPAWDALYRAAKALDGALDVVAIGPLTNLAVAFGKYPQLPGLLHRIYMMGGAAMGGNITPAAEFNVYTDPHAAQAVFRSGAAIVMCGLDVTQAAYLTPEEAAEIGSRETLFGRFFRESTRSLPRFRGRDLAPGLCLHDLCPVLYLAYPRLFTGREAGVFVETRGTVTLGKTVTDLWSDRPFPVKNTFVVLDVDRDGFAAQVRELLERD